MAIRLHRPNQSEMIQRKLFTVHNHFYVSATAISPSTASRRRVEDLDQHRIISFGEPVPSHLGDINYPRAHGPRRIDPRRAGARRSTPSTA